MKNLKVTLQQDEKGWWVVSIPKLNCHSQGKTAPQALERLAEALGLFSKKEIEAALGKP